MDRTNRWGLFGILLFVLIAFPPVCLSETNQLTGNQSVNVSLLDGRNFEGRLVSATLSNVAVEINGKKETLPTTEISVLRFPNNQGSATATELSAKEKRLLELRDGSRIYGSSFTGKGNTWLMESETFGKLELPTSSLRHLLFTPLLDDAQKTAWDEALSDDGNNDALIVVRATGEFVRVGGTIREAKAEQIQFDFDGQDLAMPLERLKGITWFQTEKPLRSSSVEVQLTNKTTLQCNSLELREREFVLVIASDREVRVPIDRVSMIQFAAANMKWVAELPPLDASLQSPVPWEFSINASKSALLPRFLKYQTSTVATKSLLPIEEQSLLFASPGSYLFRVPDGFQTLQATVERPEHSAYRSQLVIEVWQENDKLFSKVLEDKEDSMEVKVKVAPEKKTRLSVSTVGQSNLGTEVQWKQVRVLR